MSRHQGPAGLGKDQALAQKLSKVTDRTLNGDQTGHYFDLTTWLKLPQVEITKKTFSHKYLTLQPSSAPQILTLIALLELPHFNPNHPLILSIPTTMPVNWKDPKAFERLLAAMVAAQEMKIATMYGEGATYDAIEGRFRIIKKEAAKLLSEVESGERPVAPARGPIKSEDGADVSTPKKSRKPRSTNTTPRVKKSAGGDKVASGRVTKSTESSPKKKDKNLTGVVLNGVKEEVGSSESSMYEDATMGMDVEGVAEGLGLDGTFGYAGSFDMEV
ncbi:MAG: hypothetical protein Q9166_004884 [cf. Caloplaca sp. 2 TL-2023]